MMWLTILDRRGGVADYVLRMRTNHTAIPLEVMANSAPNYHVSSVERHIRLK